MSQGVIHKALSGFYYVKTPDKAFSPDLVRCTARGRFRHDKNAPLVGDRVAFSATEHGRGILTDILPRKNAFARPPLANLDIMVIVVSRADPATDPFLVDKMTVIATASNCKVVICINKLDLGAADDLSGIYELTGFPVIKTSAVTGEGIDGLASEIKGALCAFCGNSGAGKSSILNAIEPGFEIKTGDISRKLGRGRHTTRHTQLYELSCGALVADTPGFSAFDTGYIAAPGEMQNLFPEFKPYLGNCRFDDCSHIAEPGCAVLEALRQGCVHEVRHESYRRLYRQASEYKTWEHR